MAAKKMVTVRDRFGRILTMAADDPRLMQTSLTGNIGGSHSGTNAFSQIKKDYTIIPDQVPGGGAPGVFTPGIGGGVPGSGGPGGGQGPGLYQNLLDSFTKAQADAKGANENRYQDILGRYQQLRESAASHLQGLGEQEKADVRENFASKLGGAYQGLANSGMYNSTLRTNAALGAAREESSALNRVNERLQSQRLGYETSLAGDQLRFMENRTDSYPDLNMYAGLLKGLGESGYSGAGLQGASPGAYQASPGVGMPQGGGVGQAQIPPGADVRGAGRLPKPVQAPAGGGAYPGVPAPQWAPGEASSPGVYGWGGNYPGQVAQPQFRGQRPGLTGIAPPATPTLPRRRLIRSV